MLPLASPASAGSPQPRSMSAAISAGKVETFSSPSGVGPP
jgi:hypothetical protein